MKPFLYTTTAMLLAASLIATGLMIPHILPLWCALGAWLFFILHVMRVRFYFQNMPAERDEYFIMLILQKDYLVNMYAYIFIILAHTVFGYFVWQGFYGGTAFFSSWMVSELLEWLMIYLPNRKKQNKTK